MSTLVDLVGLSRFLYNIDNKLKGFVGQKSGTWGTETYFSLGGNVGTGLLSISENMNYTACTLMIYYGGGANYDKVKVACIGGTLPSDFLLVEDDGNLVTYLYNGSMETTYSYTFVCLTGDLELTEAPGTIPMDPHYPTIATIATSEDVGGIESALDAILYSNNTAIEQSLSNI